MAVIRGTSIRAQGLWQYFGYRAHHWVANFSAAH
jgi:hypothetical protein